MNDRPRLGKASAMIGMIRFGFRGAIAEAILRKDGCWICPAVPCLVHPLNILYSPNWDGVQAGRRHLEEAASWLKGTVAFEDGSRISGTAGGPVAGVGANPFDRRFRDLTRSSAKRFDRVTACAAAKMCRVEPEMILLWVETGAWPLPRRDGATSATFGVSEVEDWLATGAWPAGAHFHDPPEDEAPPTVLARTSRWLLSETIRIEARSSIGYRWPW